METDTAIGFPSQPEQQGDPDDFTLRVRELLDVSTCIEAATAENKTPLPNQEAQLASSGTVPLVLFTGLIKEDHLVFTPSVTSQQALEGECGAEQSNTQQ